MVAEPRHQPVLDEAEPAGEVHDGGEADRDEGGAGGQGDKHLCVSEGRVRGGAIRRKRGCSRAQSTNLRTGCWRTTLFNLGL